MRVLTCFAGLASAPKPFDIATRSDCLLVAGLKDIPRLEHCRLRCSM
jgi:hypothetical protein